MKICHLPPRIKPGDLLTVIAPSGALREYDSFHQGLELWKQRGYRLLIVDGVGEKWGYLAGTDLQRRAQLLTAWNHPESKGILCARGGYGAARLLENFEFDYTKNPQVLIGFSDVTALLWALAKQGISAVHGPVLTTMAKEPEWSLQRLFDWVENYQIAPLKGRGWGGGNVKGILLPGNLTVATHLLHTVLQPDLENVILALEDVTEAPYRIDRMLTQWRLMGVLTKVKGIALGRFSRCESDTPSFTVEEVLRDRLSDLNIPIVSDLPFGHDGVNAILPVGVAVNLDADQGILSIEI
jgi:muramoyltetrapeptide carboxypeptidase